MRIVHLTSVHDRRDPRIFDKMLSSLQVAGHECILIACSSTDYVEKGISIIGVAKGKTRLRTIQRVYAKAKKLDADVFHLHDPELLPIGYLLQRTGAKVVYDIHEDYRSKGGFVGSGIRAVEKWAFGWLDHVIIAEDAYRSFVSKSVSVTPILNYHIWDVEAARKLTAQTGRSRRIVYTGVVSKLRGLDTILSLAKLSKSSGRDWIFVIAGICHLPQERKDAKAFIQRHELEQHVELKGWEAYLPSEEIRNVQRDGDVGLVLLKEHANYVDSVPTKFYEFMSCGLPFLCSDFPLWEDFIRANGCGVTCPSDTIEEISATLESLLSDPKLYNRLSAMGVKQARDYHWSQMEPRLLTVYESLLTE